MTSHSSDGIQYGRCLFVNCVCSQFLLNSGSVVVCECGHVARNHKVVQACSLCVECPVFEKIGPDECKNCPHKFAVHFDALHTHLKQSPAAALSFTDIRRENNDVRSVRREMLHDMRASTSRSSHGGPGRNQGRKLKVEETSKTFEVAAVRSAAPGGIRKVVMTERHLITVDRPVSVDKTMSMCRRELEVRESVLIPQMLLSHHAERIYSKLTGPSFERTSVDGEKYLADPKTKSFYYYHPKFDGDLESDSDDAADPSAKRPRSDDSTGALNVAGGSSICHVSSSGAAFSTGAGGSSHVPSNGAAFSTGMGNNSQVDDDLLQERYIEATSPLFTEKESEDNQACLEECLEAYPGVPRQIMEIICNTHNGNSSRIADFMENGYVDGEFTKSASLGIFHEFASVPFTETDDRTFKFRIDRDGSEFETEASYAKAMQLRLERKFKSQPEKARLKLEVTFDDEDGVGDGLTRDLVGMMQKFSFSTYFEGQFDSRIPRKGICDQDWIVVGRMMGCIMRQQMVVYPGLSPVVKNLIVGQDAECVDVDVKDVPNLDLRTTLEKVLDGSWENSLDIEERKLLSQNLEEAEALGYAVSLDGLWVPTKGKVRLAVDQIIRHQIIHHRRAPYIFISKGIDSVCRLTEFIAAVSNRMRETIVSYYFPVLNSLTVDRKTLIDILRYRCTESSKTHLIPVAREQLETFISTLDEGFLDERSTVTMVRRITGEPFIYPDERITINLIDSNVDTFAHSCTKELDLGLGNFEDPERLKMFQINLDHWLGDKNEKYNSR